MKKLTLLLFTIQLSALLCAQNSSSTAILDLATLKDSVAATDFAMLFIDSNKIANLDNLSTQNFAPLQSYDKRRRLPIPLITKPIYLHIHIVNGSDNLDSLYFYPGFIFSEVIIYKKNVANQLERLSVWGANTGYTGFQLQPREEAELYFKLKACKTDAVGIVPQFISKKYLSNYVALRQNKNASIRMVGFVLSGILLMMFFFTAANYLNSRKKDFLFYCLYSLCIFLLIYLYAQFHNLPSIYNAVFRSYFDFFLLLVGTIFYVAFTRSFLESKTTYPVLDKIFKAELYFLFFILFTYTYLHFFTDIFWLENIIENAMKFIALAIGVVYVAFAFLQKKRIINYIAIGAAALIAFSSISLSLIWLNINDLSIYSSSLFYYDIGLVLSLICYLLGLTYKNREELIQRTKREESLKMDAKKLEFENQLAVIKAQQEERNRISADMHDDLGAGMTSIRLYSELAKSRVKDLDIPEIDKISFSANELLNKMNAIIWSMSSANDSLENMIAYIRSYAYEYFDNTGIQCTIQLPEQIPHALVNGTIRRNLFLVVKEALNNILKHAGATEVGITLTAKDKLLVLTIQDNGKGIDFNNLRQFSNGLKNMQKRMDDVDILFKIENNHGTLITLIREIKS